MKSHSVQVWLGGCMNLPRAFSFDRSTAPLSFTASRWHSLSLSLRLALMRPHPFRPSHPSRRSFRTRVSQLQLPQEMSQFTAAHVSQEMSLAILGREPDAEGAGLTIDALLPSVALRLYQTLLLYNRLKDAPALRATLLL